MPLFQPTGERTLIKATSLSAAVGQVLLAGAADMGYGTESVLATANRSQFYSNDADNRWQNKSPTD